MTDTFDYLKDLIETGKWGKSLLSQPQPALNEACHQRLFNALVATGKENEPSPLDLVGLIRHFLRREDEDIQGGTPQILKVPRNYPYPYEKKIWQQCGINILRENKDYFLICANDWRPKWLNFSESPEKQAFAEVEQRNYHLVSGDPFLSLGGLTHYRSIGQREAIRAVLSAPAKATMVINLPTGGGKSLCAQLPALLASKQGGVSVVVVPTTALALDQERALSTYISHPTAYYGDTSEAGKQRRREIRQRISQGTQRIVFTSPESLISSLSFCLYDAAKREYLRYFVVDEVHLVEEWGDEFRPAFQEIVGLRKNLLRWTSFRTLLLTATLTESCLDTLENLFGQPGEFKVMSAVQLRREPSYWISQCKNEEQRREQLLEAINHLPRPIIIYTSTRKDVDRWSKELCLAGFKRFASMTGNSSTQERSQLIHNWRNKDIDIVVATSAFGLGVDQNDVRTVIHVCIPETVDLFYQEVGRGGRDGKASISLTLYTKEDYAIAESLNKKSSITCDRGLQRWKSMFDNKISIGEDLYQVPINIRPSMSDKDIDMENQQNSNWNIRTLMLMIQADLIEIDWKQPPHRQDFSETADYQRYCENYQNSRIIRIKNQFHLQSQTWENYVEPIRQHRQQQSTRNLDLMKEVLWERPNRCLSEIFAEAYTILARNEPIERKKVTVSAACGGCPWCRQQQKQSFAQIMPHPAPIWQKSPFFLREDLQRIIKDENLVLIFYEVSQTEKIDTLLKWLIHQGVKNLISPVAYKNIFLNDTIVFLYNNFEPIKLYRLPTVIYHQFYRPFPKKYLNITNFNVPVIIIVPKNIPDPNREDRRLIDMFNGRNFPLEVLVKEFNL